jgi:hypothetical protein
LAKQENCPLVSGDKRLRKAADKEKVEKLGTIWLVEQMLIHGLLTISRAEASKELMRQAGSRLPWAQLDEMLDRYRNQQGPSCPRE